MSRGSSLSKVHLGDFSDWVPYDPKRDVRVAQLDKCSLPVHHLPMFRRKKPKDSTGRFIDQVCESLEESGWDCEGPTCMLGIFRRVFRHETGIVINHWGTYCKEMLWFREPQIRITEAEEKRVNQALVRWVRRQRRETANLLVQGYLNGEHAMSRGPSVPCSHRIPI